MTVAAEWCVVAEGFPRRCRAPLGLPLCTRVKWRCTPTRIDFFLRKSCTQRFFAKFSAPTSRFRFCQKNLGCCVQVFEKTCRVLTKSCVGAGFERIHAMIPFFVFQCGCPLSESLSGTDYRAYWTLVFTKRSKYTAVACTTHKCTGIFQLRKMSLFSPIIPKASGRSPIGRAAAKGFCSCRTPTQRMPSPEDRTTGWCIKFWSKVG